MTGTTAAVVIENVAQTRQLETALDDRATNTGSGSNEDDHEDRFVTQIIIIYSKNN